LIKVYNKNYIPAEISGQIVDRSSNWGNPFPLGIYTREESLKLFRKYATWRLTIEPGWLRPLKDQNLICYCAPKACHADILMELANGW